MDAINFSLAIDNYVAGAYKNLEPHKSVFSLDEPYKVSGNLSMPKPVISTISSWLDLSESFKDNENEIGIIAEMDRCLKSI